MARVLLIRPGLGEFYRGVAAGLAVTHSPPLNLAMLAASLRARGHHVRVLDLEVGPRLDLATELRSAAPDLVGVTFRTPQWDQALGLATLVRNVAPQARTIAGGPHASALPESCVLTGGFDMALQGEGEDALAALADGTDPAAIPGLHWADGRSAAPGRAPVDLDALPLPAWEDYDLQAYGGSLVTRGAPVADLESSRGCPFGCIYCSKAVFGRKFAPFSPARFLEGVERAQAAGFRSFNLVDDTFTTDRARAVAICEGLARRPRPLPWTCTNGLRVDAVDVELLRLAQRAGCRLVAFGLESGSSARLAEAGKGASLAQGRAAVEAAHTAGLTTVGYFMLGLPGETAESLEETIAFACSLPLDFAKFALTMPLPGTPLWRRWRDRLASPFDPGMSTYRTAEAWFDHPDLPWPVLRQAHGRAHRAFYGRPRQAARLVGRLAWRAISAAGRP
jgi:anaerobic magnesium-protoporphyrin IX monomethyl ester cyclase